MNDMIYTNFTFFKVITKITYNNSHGSLMHNKIDVNVSRKSWPSKIVSAIKKQ